MPNRKGLHFNITGKGAHTIVWIHGFGGNDQIWNKSIPSFSDFTNISFDYLGHGHSSKDISAELSIARTIELASEVIQEYQHGNLFWVAHSFGGNLITALANKFAASKGLVLVDCSCYLTESALKRRRDIAKTWLDSDNLQKSVSDLYDMLIGPQVSDSTKKEIKKSLQQCSPRFLLELYHSYRDRPEALAQKDIPALIFEAEHFSAKEDAHSFIQLLPHAERIFLAGKYHFFFYEDEKYFNDKLRSFFQF